MERHTHLMCTHSNTHTYHSILSHLSVHLTPILKDADGLGVQCLKCVRGSCPAGSLSTDTHTHTLTFGAGPGPKTLLNKRADG